MSSRVRAFFFVQLCFDRSREKCRIRNGTNRTTNIHNTAEQSEFTKVMTAEAFTKEHMYNIRHAYGKEGNDTHQSTRARVCTLN